MEEKPIEFTLPEFSVECGGAGMSLEDDPGELLHGCSQALSGPLSSLGSSELSLSLEIKSQFSHKKSLNSSLYLLVLILPVSSQLTGLKKKLQNGGSTTMEKELLDLT